MARSKRIGLLLAILAVLCAATFAMTFYQQKQEEIQASGAVILEISPNSVSALSWEFIEGGFSFRREDDTWLYDGGEAFPVSESKLQDILSHFESFSAAFIIENAEDLSQYGLDSPVCTLCISADEETYEIKVGDFSKMDEQRYVDIGDGNVYLVNTDPMDFLPSALSSMIAHDEVPHLNSAEEITFRGSESYSVSREEESSSYSKDDIYFARRGEESLPLDSERVEDYLSTISNLSLINYVTYQATEEDLAACGLDDPELSISISYTGTEDSDETETFVLHIGQNAEELSARQAAEDAGKEMLPDVTKYVRIGDSPIIYELEDLSYRTLCAAGYDDLRHREVFWADFEDVTQIDLTLEDATHTLTSGEEDGEMLWYYQGEAVELSSLQSALEALKADSFTDETPSEKEELSLTLHLNNEMFPTTKIQLYRYDGSLCLAVVDGESVSLVERSAVMELVESVQAMVLNATAE